MKLEGSLYSGVLIKSTFTRRKWDMNDCRLLLVDVVLRTKGVIFEAAAELTAMVIF